MYFITTISPKATRCVGYVDTEEEAVKIIENNTCDLYEAGYYPNALIENIKPGIYQYDQNPIWFKYNEELDKYVKSEKPNYIDSHLVGFSIG